MTDKPLLSIVVTSYTMVRLKDVFELLDHILAQTYPNVETILVVERSMELLDRLKQYVHDINLPNVNVIFNDGEQGLSAARNLGIAKASGEIIAFIDDDAFPVSNWAEEMVRTYNTSSVMAVTGPSIPLWEKKGLDWVPEEFYWIFGGSGYREWIENREIRNVSGTNMSFRKEAFAVTGLFQTRLGAIEGGGGLGKQEFGGEETDFCIRLRRIIPNCIIYNPRVIVYHRVYKYRLNFKFISRRAYSEGYTKAMFKINYPMKKCEKNLLDVEYQLLGRIFTKLMPEILKGFFTKPLIAWHRLTMTLNVVLSVGFGYLCYMLKNFSKRDQTISDNEKG